MTLYIPPGTSAGEVRSIVQNDPYLNSQYGWLMDGGGNGALIAVRAINAVYRAESIGDRQACKASGGFYVTRGQLCLYGEDAYDYTQGIPEASPAYDRSRTWLENNSDNIDDNGWITEGPDDQALADLIEEIGQETYDQASGVLNQIKDQAGAVVDDPIGATRDIAKNILTAGTGVTLSDECSDSSVEGWIKTCVEFGVLAAIPGLEIPSAVLGSIFGGVTIQDMEDVLVAAGHKWEDIKNGVPNCGENNDQECTPGQLLEDLGDWAVEKVKDVFKDVDSGGITVESVLGKLGSFLPPAVAAVIYGEFKDKINTAIGVPVFLDTAELCEEQGTIEDPDNPGNCLPVAPVGADFDCSTVFKKGGMVEDESKCGGCLDGYDPDVNNEGGCVLAPVDCGEQVWDEIAGECVDPDPGFVEGGPCKTEGGDSGTYDAEGACVADPVEPTPCSNNATIESGCETCENGSLPSAHENGDCSQPLIPTQVTCPDNTPNKGQVVDKLSDCGEPTNPSGYDCTQPKPSGFTFSTVAWNQNCEVTHCTDGTLKDDAEGSNCPGYVAPVAPSNNCGQQDRVERPDGSCGECLPGFIEDPQGFDQCIQAPPECSDCSCAEYALENPEECATETPEPPPETGGGGGGANASGYASPPPDISYQLAGDPQLLDRQRFAGVQQGLFSRPQPTLFGSKARSETLKNFPIAEFLSQSGVFKA